MKKQTGSRGKTVGSDIGRKLGWAKNKAKAELARRHAAELEQIFQHEAALMGLVHREVVTKTYKWVDGA